jgi:hypothetical protein
MELLSVGLAKSIWLFDINDLNPKGVMFIPDALKWIAERYSFQKFPTSVTDFGESDQNATDPKGYVFKTGSFQMEDTSVLVNFAIYNDGIVADTWASTEASDIFLEELLRAAAIKFDLSLRPNTIRKKLYVSELIVRMDDLFGRIHPGLQKFNRTLDHLFERHALPSYQLSGLVFSQDTSGASYKPPGLMIERKAGVSFMEGRYWSKSPFTTTDHINALKELEKTLTS